MLNLSRIKLTDTSISLKAVVKQLVEAGDLSVNFRINLLVLINLKVGPASGKRLR